MMVNAWNKVATLFGVGHHDETDSYSIKHQSAWLERRKRLLNRRCGRLAHCEGDSNVEPRSRALDVEFSKVAKHSINKSDTDSKSSRKHQKVAHALVNASPRPATAGETATIKQCNNKLERFARSASEDTTTHRPSAKPRHLEYQSRNVDEDGGFEPRHHDDNRSLGASSFVDLTDFDAKESIVKLVNDVLARHQPKRAFGMGLVGNLLSRKFRKDLTYAQVNAIYSFNDHRPFFTYWVTAVQILIMLITLFTYGFGPFGFSNSLVSGRAEMPSLATVTVSYLEKDNIWLGPRASDLIHLGAKFTPCMRRDALIYDQISIERLEERSTGCCIKNDNSGCLQTNRESCTLNARWHSWNESTSVNNVKNQQQSNNQNRKDSQALRRVSGPVCGQDPDYCLRPASVSPHAVWPDDLTKWPICYETRQSKEPLHHMSCELTGRPCCVGIYGQCLITSPGHCSFLRGTFHPEATLCSQVSCMQDVCGLMPFYARDYPDQFYRLFTALFLHAGLIHLSFTVVIQYYIMRDIERLVGSTRMALIYILPGIAGYIASASFVPYHTQVGPSGSQFALLACLMAETINSWKLLDEPLNALMKLISIALGLFLVGLLPWIDNYAHIFGFLVGLLLSLTLTPYLTPFNDAYSRRMKVIQIWVCMLLVILAFVVLSLPLYIFPLYKCSWCQYLDCWPPYWCENQDIKLPDRTYFD